MNLGLARKVMVAVYLADGDIGVHPDDPTIHFFEARKFLERHELRLEVTGTLNLGVGLLPGEEDILLSFAGPVLDQLLVEQVGP